MPHIVYMSRGHGYGHASLDREIMAAIVRLRPGTTIDVASYGTGLEFYRSHAIACTDLRIDDDRDQGPDALLRVAAFLRSRRHADLVVGHEIFSAPAACARLGLRNVLLTHWLYSEVGRPEMDVLLEQAPAVIMLDFEEAHRVPAGLRGRLTFTGAVARPFATDRAQARRALGIAPNELVAVTATGAAHPARLAHLREVLAKSLAAWQMRDGRTGILFALTGLPPNVDDPSVRWVGWTGQPELYFSAADVVVANATFTTLCALAYNGINTIAIMGGSNPVDRLHAEFLAGKGLLQAVEVSIPAGDLWHAVDGMRRRDPSRHRLLPWSSPARVAQLLLDLAGPGKAPTMTPESGHGRP